MKIKSLRLKNFRNYDNLDIQFNDKMNIIIGNNGQGKTNILESIYVLSLTKSNREGIDSDMIQFGKDSLIIEGSIQDDDELLKKLKIVISNNSKELYINNKLIHRSKDYISNLITIAFSPVDLDIIKGSPSIRRNLLNIDLSQINNNYISYLNEFNKIIKMRNEYLKKLYINANSDFRYLDVVNEKMIEKADYIYRERFNYLNNVNYYLPGIFKKITGLDGLIIKYENTLDLDHYDDTLKDVYLKKLKRKKDYELMQGMTLIGPHRDDFVFYLNDKDMRLFASQGQQRMAVIALKISELMIYKEKFGITPILLLDDIFSEIDIKKRNKIVRFLKEDIQTIITTTDIKDISDKIVQNSNIYIINDGNCKLKKGKKNNGRRKS